MKKITFENGKAPYLSAANLNALQQNVEDAITESETTINQTITTLENNKLDKTSKATSTEAIAGTNNTKYTTPASVKSAIDKALEGYTPSGGGKKEVGYADEQLEGTEAILIDESDFAGENSIELAKVEQNLSSNSEDKVPSIKAVNDAFESGEGYIKYVDGTMICYGTVSITNPTHNDWYGFCRLTNEFTFSLPKAFKDNNYSLTISSTVFGYFSTIITSKTTNSFVFRACTHNQSSYTPSSGTFNYIAIGKWK